MKKIKTKTVIGKEIIVDDEDFDYLNQWKWYISQTGYAVRNSYIDGIHKHIRMHRQILNYSGKKDIDHINHNKLDNRKNNLRIINRSENMMNTKLRITNTSGYKGVSWDKGSKKWRAKIVVKGKTIVLGKYDTKEDAVISYNNKVIELYPNIGFLNNICQQI